MAMTTSIMHPASNKKAFQDLQLVAACLEKTSSLQHYPSMKFEP